MRILVYGAGGVGAWSRWRKLMWNALIGVVVRRGREAVVETPACEALYALMKAL